MPFMHISIIPYYSIFYTFTADAGDFLSEKWCRITFITPACIKRNGRFSAPPDLPSYFYSAICKYNAFENDNISYDESRETFTISSFIDYQLSTIRYNVSGHIIPGMTGFCEIRFPTDYSHNSIMRKIIAYAAYNGIGGKTSMGMGGLIAENI